jgi:hypothetical protein
MLIMNLYYHMYEICVTAAFSTVFNVVYHFKGTLTRKMEVQERKSEHKLNLINI